MLRTFLNAFRVADIRKKLAFTAAMLALYRLGAYIPAPGINIDVVEDLASNFEGQSNVLGFLNLFSGGSLQRFAIFALGIMPYITASIMLQLLELGNDDGHELEDDRRRDVGHDPEREDGELR